MKRLRIFAKTPLFGWTPCIVATDVPITDPVIQALDLLSARYPAFHYTLTAI